MAIEKKKRIEKDDEKSIITTNGWQLRRLWTDIAYKSHIGYENK